MNKIFLNYRRNDLPAAILALIHSTLEKDFGNDTVFLDKHLIGGMDWKEELKKSDKNAKICLIIIGPQWLEINKETNNPRLFDLEDWVRKEIELAIEYGLTIIPVLVDGGFLSPKSQVPASIHPMYDKQAISLETINWSVYGPILNQTVKQYLHPNPWYAKYRLYFSIILITFLVVTLSFFASKYNTKPHKNLAIQIGSMYYNKDSNNDSLLYKHWSKWQSNVFDKESNLYNGICFINFIDNSDTIRWLMAYWTPNQLISRDDLNKIKKTTEQYKSYNPELKNDVIKIIDLQNQVSPEFNISNLSVEGSPRDWMKKNGHKAYQSVDQNPNRAVY